MLPLLTLFILLGVLRMSAWKAALFSLLVALLVAVLVYPMPVGQALLAGTEGAAFGFFPIMWIVINAIWVYNMTVVTGHFDVLRRSFARVSDDQRIQAVIIAFCFGALLEALAGFGTPVAITSVMLIALGFKPIKAATVALVANTAPVAFGALAVPITTLGHGDRQPPEHTLGADGRPADADARRSFVPMAWCSSSTGGAVSGRPCRPTLVCGIAFARRPVRHVQLPVDAADRHRRLAASGAAATVLLLRVWRPAQRYVEERRAGHRRRAARRGAAAWSPRGRTPAGSDGPAARAPATADDLGARDDGRARQAAARCSGRTRRTSSSSCIFSDHPDPGGQGPWSRSRPRCCSGRGCDLQTASGKPSTIPTFKLNWLSAAGTLLIIAGLITIPVIGISLRRAWKTYVDTYRQLRRRDRHGDGGPRPRLRDERLRARPARWARGWPAPVRAFALLSPILGWLGVAVTGSDTSSNSLFGALQVHGRQPDRAQPRPDGGGELLRRGARQDGLAAEPRDRRRGGRHVRPRGRRSSARCSAGAWGSCAFMCVLVYLQSTPVLSWMVP